MKKAVWGTLLLLCLGIGSLLMGNSSEAATKWHNGRTIVVRKGAFTFKAHPAVKKKQAWIYSVKVNPKKGSTKTLKFPAKIKGRTVTKLGWSDRLKETEEFYTNIFGVVVEEAHGCDGYTASIRKTRNMTIPKSVKEITNCAFSGMRALKQVKLPDHLTSLSRSMFYGCENLKTVTLPKKLKEFDQEVFAECNSIAAMKISKANKRFTIKKGLVMSKNSKTLIWALPTKDKVTIPNKVEWIQANAFRDCCAEKLYIPASVTFIEAWALYAPTVVDIRVDSRNPVYARDGQCIFNKNTGELVVAIVKDKKIVISSKVTILNGNASMAGASVTDDLDRIDIPASVRELETYWIFFEDLDCKVYFHSLTPPHISEIVPGYEYAALPSFNPVYVPAASKEAYQQWAIRHFSYDDDNLSKDSGFLHLYTF